MSTLKVNTLQTAAGVEVYTAKAWVNFNGTGTVAIRASGNVSSITDNGTGDYTINFTNALPDANYCAIGTIGDIVPTFSLTAASTARSIVSRAKTTTTLRILNNSGTGVAADYDTQDVAVFR
jgi:hypothetical protein